MPNNTRRSGGITNNQALLGLLRHFEGERLNAYNDSEGIPTIGIGATSYQNGQQVKMGDRITKHQSEALLQHHINLSLGKLQREQGYQLLSPNARAAIESFAYNAGSNFLDNKNFSTIAAAVKAGDERALGCVSTH